MESPRAVWHNVTQPGSGARRPRTFAVHPDRRQSNHPTIALKKDPMTHLQITDRGEVVVVTFNEPKILDEYTIDQIGQEFDKLTLEAAADRKLLLNFAKVGFMSSSMIGKIVRLNKKCKADKIKLKLCNISPNIMEVFRLTQLHKLLDIHANEADAIKAFGQSGLGWFGKR